MVTKIDKSYLNEFKELFQQGYISKRDIVAYDIKINNIETYQKDKFEEFERLFYGLHTSNNGYDGLYYAK